ncbi:MAG TPA: hypothetical protein VE078_12210 [Thermoanaerobaculia bacterium]|nr:hypothetical protein [Thermoanaerobaculia bacterium]
MALLRLLLPILALAALAQPAQGQRDLRRPATGDLRPQTVRGVTIDKNSRLGLLVNNHVTFPTSGVYTDENGIKLVVEDGAIRELAAPAGALAVKYLGSPDTRTAKADCCIKIEPAQGRVANKAEVEVSKAVQKITVSSTRLADDGSVRLQSRSGEIYELADGTFVGEGSARGIIIQFSNGRPSGLVAPGL